MNVLHLFLFSFLSITFASQVGAVSVGRIVPSRVIGRTCKSVAPTLIQKRAMIDTVEKTEDIFYYLERRYRRTHNGMFVYAYHSEEDSAWYPQNAALLEGYYDSPLQLQFPVRFYEDKEFPYKKRRDFLCDVLGRPLLITERFKELLEAHEITGWKTYPIVLIGRDGKEITDPKYYGFSVIGRGGPRDFSKVDASAIATGYGIYIDPATWDGSDIFFEREFWADLFISRRAIEVFAKQDVFDFIPLSEAPYSTSSYETYQEKKAEGYQRPYCSIGWKKKEE